LAHTSGKFRNTVGLVANWLAFMATLAVAFFLTPFLVMRLGIARYDVWCIVEAILTYFTVLDLGVAACLVRTVAARDVRSTEPVSRMLSCCAVVFTVAGGITLLLGIPILYWMSGTLDAKLDGGEGSLPFMLLMLLNIALTLPLSAFPAILEGLGAFTTKSVIRLVALAIRAAGLVWCAGEWSLLFPLALIYTATLLIEHAAMAVACKLAMPGLRFRWSHVDRSTLRALRLYSLHAFLAMVAGRISVSTGSIVIGLLLPAGHVTYFATAMRLVEYAKGMLRTLTAPISPKAAKLDAAGDSVGLARLFCTGMRWISYAALPVPIGLWMYGEAFLTRWVGAEFGVFSTPVLMLLATTIVPSLMQSVASRVLYGTGQLRFFALTCLAESGANLLLLAVLLPLLGVSGASIAGTAPVILASATVVIWTMRKYRVRWVDLGDAVIGPLLLNAALGVAWWFARTTTPDYVVLVVRIGLGLAIYIAAVFAWEFRNRFTHLLRTRATPISSAVDMSL